MGWKYIMFENKIGDTTFLFPVIFPDKMVHSEVADSLRRCQPGWHHGGVKPVSAGMIDQLYVEGVNGESETLKMASKAGDEQVINVYNYFHGIV